MRRATLLALGIMLAGIWPQDGVRAQASTKPPVSIAPPNALPAPNPAADYDGFSASVNGDNETASQAAPARSRAARSSKSGADAADPASVDQEDDALKRKLTICKNCK
ncbi:hypothetical protein JQ581_15975 [Bradyrhizobium liaoningense]|uniref:hypothetical protein n=1 Tax=Bradyrhizobium liaoningense TaxID=43992 RepID=UPI001BAA3637|nr:hypothetical protein [Bradyrhizobium liaoningense]MBR0738432.1 hypothetical protein [Bradyrhizobium liaoningense]